jgi:hypothetical protein
MLRFANYAHIIQAILSVAGVRFVFSFVLVESNISDYQLLKSA